jgi:hypothetical protein
VVVPAYAQKRDASAALNDAAIDVAMFRYDDGAARFETIARDATYADADRSVAAVNAVRLRSVMASRDKLRDAISAALRLPLASDDRSAVEYALADFDYRTWEHGGDPASRALALTSSTAFFSAHRRGANRERLVESAYRVSRLKRSAGESATDWLRTTADVWTELAATTPRPQIVFSKYAASAEIDLVTDEIHASPLNTAKQCRYMTYSADARLADGFDGRLDAIATRHATSLESVAEAEATRGVVFDDLRSGLYWCGGSWWTTSAALYANASQYTSWLMSSFNPTTNTNPPAAAVSAWQLYQQAKTNRDQLIDGAMQGAIKHYALPLDFARAQRLSTAALQHAAQEYLALLLTTGDDAVRLVVERTTSLLGPRRLRFGDISATARGLTVIRTSPAVTDGALPTPLPP